MTPSARTRLDQCPARGIAPDRGDERSCRAPSRPSQRAVFAAEPPWTSATRPGTSVPGSSGRAGASTTSSIRSPSTTTRAGSAGRRPVRRPARSSGGASVVAGRRGRPRSRHGAALRWRIPGRDAPRYNGRALDGRADRSHDGARPMTLATDLDQLAIDTIRTLVDRRRPEGELRSPGRPDGRRADGLRRCGPGSCATPRPIRTGPTATASC